ncbi:hypothetical protein [Streptomyces syringium]|uniref:hypothetical protein n=1 Tax=Streptomyces syringium TaxID=76729 RepID=UPI0037D3740E
MTDTDQLKREQDALAQRLATLESALTKKATKEEKEELPLGVLWSNKDWKANLTTFVEIVAITKATSIVKLGLPAILDLGKIFESLIEKRFKRNSWGWLFGKKPVDPLDEQVSRIDALERRMGRSEELRGSVVRFNTQYPASRSDRIDSDIQSLKGKIRHLETDRSNLRSRANATPPPRRSSVDGIGNLTQVAQQINRLEDRITHLARALG